MPDTRRVETVAQVLARLERDLHNLRTTMMARVVRRPTGDIEPSLRGSAKPGTLVLDGRTVFRSEYPALWTWAVEHGLDNGPFGPGDGSSTFELPTLHNPDTPELIWLIWS